MSLFNTASFSLLGVIGLALFSCTDGDETVESQGVAEDTNAGTPQTSDEPGSTLAATLHLTGSDCRYDGPTEVPADSQIDIQLINATNVDGGFVFVQIPSDSSYERLNAYVQHEAEVIAQGERSSPPPRDVGIVRADLPQLPPGEERIETFDFREGTYTFVCLEQTTGLTRRDLAIYITEPIVSG